MTVKNLYLLMVIAITLLTLPQSGFSACSNPAREEGTIIYNSDQHVPQICADSTWIALGAISPSAGGGSCTDPDREEGAIVYNVDHKVAQYCNGADWVSMGGVALNTGLVGIEPAASYTFEDGTIGPFVTGGDANWFVSTTSPQEGTYSLESGNIADQQDTWVGLTVTLSAPKTIAFYRWVSSETCCDRFHFYVDYQRIGNWGTTAWGEITHPLTAGTHLLKWVYVKDGNTSSGSDNARIDNIRFQ